MRHEDRRRGSPRNVRRVPGPRCAILVPMTSLCIAQDPDADALLEREPLALLLGMLLDQQVPMEWAFQAPAILKERLGGQLDAGKLAAMGEDAVVQVFASDMRHFERVLERIAGEPFVERTKSVLVLSPLLRRFSSGSPT